MSAEESRRQPDAGAAHQADAAEAPPGARVAFFGATTLLARELRSLLESRGFLALDVKLFDAQGEGVVSDFAGEALVTTVPDEEETAGLDIGFMCGTISETVKYLGWAGRKGFTAIDLTGSSRIRPGVPVAHMDVNPGSIVRTASIIAAPHAVSHNLSSIVAGARAAGPIARVEAIALRPVSDLGEPGVDELYRQTVGLLNFSEVPQEVFGRQIAFNVVPSTGIQQSQAEDFDLRVQEEVVSILDLAPGRVSAASIIAPVFHGHTLAVTLVFEEPREISAVESALQAAPGINVVRDPALFSPVELAGEETIAVMDLRAEPDRPERVRLWSICDNLKGGAGLNAIRIAERAAELRRGRA